jgi:hypothetical protein
VCDVFFAIKTLKASQEDTFAAEDAMVQVIAVAAGKVRVMIAGQEAFSIGAHGVWKLGAGHECKVHNVMYGDAVLHITTIV